MFKIDNVEIVGWEPAIRGMRNPMNSWDKSDSGYGCDEQETDCIHCIYHDNAHNECAYEHAREFMIGPNDAGLMRRLRNAGTDHRKFMRMITVYMDITAPLYWWKEFDTYKVGTVANSCSTMHKIHAKEFTFDDFSHEHLIDNKTIKISSDGYELSSLGLLGDTIGMLNTYRDLYLETKDKKYWWQMIQMLPSSYNQKRTIMLNYEVLANIYKSRKNHNLDEWRIFCEEIMKLPHADLISGDE